MATMKLNSQDRRDLDKFIRFLALKTVQIIVQSRLGEKIKTKSKPHSSGSDWFNLSVKDMPEVLAETKKALGGQIPTIGLNMCIEISLKTVEGDAMVLETWCLGMTDQCDSMARITYAVYNRMGLLLKSLIAVTRVTPAYKLSCRQGPDSYVICYRVYLGDPQLYALGDGYQQVRVGQVGTPIGTLILSVTYRTKLTITPQKVERECPFMVKSDHFKPDLSPKWLHKPWLTDIKSTVIDELAAACEDCQELGCAPLSSSPPRECNGVHFHQHCRSPIIDKKSPRFEGDIRPCSIPDQQITQQHQGRPMSFSDSKKVGAFAEESKKPDPTSVSEYFVPDVPFSRLLLHDCDNNVIPNGNIIGAPLKKMTNNNINHNNNNNINCVDQIDNSDNHSDKSSSSMVSGTTDDFVLVELKPPFAGSDPNSDLGAFYRECQAAPPLLSFSDHPSLAEQVNDLSNQLAAFEMNLHDFDELVDSLSHNDGWK